MTRMSGGVRKWIFPSVMLVAIGFLVWFGIRRRNQSRKGQMFIELKAIQTPKGWGYDILADGRIFIHQNIIPAVPGEYGFRTKEDALAVGQKVYQRVLANQIPMVSIEEIKALGVYPDTTARPDTAVHR
jgi:hypothetical protein